MTIIYKNESCKVEKVKNQKYKITIFTEEKYPKFWKTVKTNLEKYSNKKDFLFEAKEVLLLNTLLKRSDHSLSYFFCKSIFLNIGKQFEYLEKDGYASVFLDTNDILVIISKDEKDTRFIYLNTTKFLPLDHDKIKINLPFKKNNLYISPELKKIKKFPTTIYKQSTYYSLGLLVSNCLTPIKESKRNMEEFKKHLESILNTKIYWALLRCLEYEPEDRYYLYI